MAFFIGLFVAFAYNGHARIAADLTEEFPSQRPGWTFRPTLAKKIFVFLSWWVRPFLQTRPNSFQSIGLGFFSVVGLMISPTIVFWGSELLAERFTDTYWLQTLIFGLFGGLGMVLFGPWISVFTSIVIMPVSMALIYFCDRIVHSTLFKWIIVYLPSVMAVTVASACPFFLAIALLGNDQVPLKVALLWIDNLIVVSVFAWASIRFAPKDGKHLGVLLFSVPTIYFLLSSVAAFQGKEIFGDDLPASETQFWILKNLVWFMATLAPLIFFTRKVDRNIQTHQEVKV